MNQHPNHGDPLPPTTSTSCDFLYHLPSGPFILLADAFQDNGELCIFCTVSPCATDTEHSISTLRTGFALTGRPGIYTRVFKQTELEKFVNPDPVKRAVPPHKWDVKHVQNWLQSVLLISAIGVHLSYNINLVSKLKISNGKNR